MLLNCAASGADAVVASHKAATGADVTVGIESAISALLEMAQVPPNRVSSLMIGTTVSGNCLDWRMTNCTDWW